MTVNIVLNEELSFIFGLLVCVFVLSSVFWIRASSLPKSGVKENLYNSQSLYANHSRISKFWSKDLHGVNN